MVVFNIEMYQNRLTTSVYKTCGRYPSLANSRISKKIGWTECVKHGNLKSNTAIHFYHCGMWIKDSWMMSTWMYGDLLKQKHLANVGTSFLAAPVTCGLTPCVQRVTSTYFCKLKILVEKRYILTCDGYLQNMSNFNGIVHICGPD